MLDNQSDQIRVCYEQALDCAREAAHQTDLPLKLDLFDLARRWRALAASYKAGTSTKLIHDTPQQAAWRSDLIRTTIRWRERAIEGHHLLANTRASIAEIRRELSDSRRLIDESRLLLAGLECQPSPCRDAATIAGGSQIVASENLSVRVFQDGARFGWTLSNPADEVLGRGTAKTELKARADAFEAGMTYMDLLKGGTSPCDTDLQ